MDVVKYPSMPLEPPKMTLIDVKKHLFAHFLNQSTFNLETDLAKVKLGGAYDDGDEGVFHTYKEPLFRAALDDLERTRVVAQLDDNQYILVQPLTTVNQEIVLSAPTANLIADILNSCVIDTNQSEYVVNKLAISDIDINILAQLCALYKAALAEISKQFGEDGNGESFDETPGIGDN